MYTAVSPVPNLSHEGDMIMKNNHSKTIVDRYNNEAGEMLAQVMTGVDPWQ